MADLLEEPRHDRRAVRSRRGPRLAPILAETGLTEIEIEDKDGRIRVVRAPAPVTPPATRAAAPLPRRPPPPAGAPPPRPTRQHPGAVLSPMVGIAYLSPEPGAPPSSRSARR